GTGAELTNGQPRKSSCHSARYFSRSLPLTYSQYAFSRFQTCASSFAESCAKAVVASTSRNGMGFNIPRSYYWTPDGENILLLGCNNGGQSKLHIERQ